jgi:peptidoglycan/LPS O-acetylase OafA/YrhL
MINWIARFFAGMPGNLGRITSGSGFIPEIDGLRFLAIVPVVIMHFSERLHRVESENMGASEQQVAHIFDNGHIGVYLFFAISGFILAMPFAAHKLLGKPAVSLNKYYLRRLTRLEPPYILIMTLLFVALVVVKHEDIRALFPHFLASMVYLHRLIYGTWTPINPPSWTLEIEVQFYVLAPFLALLYFSIGRKWLRRGIMIAVLIGKIFLDNLTTAVDPLYQTLPFVVQFFLIGILMADIFLTDWREGIRQHRIFDWITLVSLIVLFSTWTWGKDLSWKFFFLAALFSTFYSSFRSITVNRFLRNPWVTAIGGMCYTIYLLHLAFAEFFVMTWHRLLPGMSYGLSMVLGLIVFLPALFIVSCIFFVLIEKPCMDPQWPRKLRDWAMAPFRSSPRSTVDGPR